MTGINSLSDKPKFTIKTAGELTGIIPVTLRAWERRYGVLSPERSENTYRLYSDQDVAVLRWLKSKVDSGISISTAATMLRDMRSKNEWPEILPIGTTHPMVPNTIPPEQYARDLFEKLTDHNENDAARLFQDAMAGFSLSTLLTEVITPCLNAIGNAWYQGNLRISTEHFASAFFISRLNILFSSFPVISTGPAILIGGGPGNEHEMGALMMATLLRSKSFRVEFLGPNLPVDDLVDHANTTHPTLVILTASTNTVAMELLRVQAKLNGISNTPRFCFAGPAFDIDAVLRSKIPGVYLGDSMINAVEIISQLLSTN